MLGLAILCPIESLSLIATRSWMLGFAMLNPTYAQPNLQLI
jgi:hypothetical protein